MKDNTVTYVVVGALAAYLLLKKNTTVLPNGSIAVGPLTVLPASQQTGLTSSFLASVLASVAAISNTGAVVPPPASSFILATGTATESPGTLEVTDATGTTSFSNGAVFDPGNNYTLDSPSTLTAPVIPASTDDSLDFSSDDE